MCFNLVKDFLLELTFFSKGCVKIGLQLIHLILGDLLDLDFLALKRLLHILKPFVQLPDLHLMLLSERSNLLSIAFLFVLHLGLKAGDLGCQLFAALLQFLLKPIETFAHDVLLQIGVQIVCQFVKPADPRSQALWCLLQFVLKRLFRGEQLLLLCKQLGRLFCLISDLAPLRDFFLGLLKLLFKLVASFAPFSLVIRLAGTESGQLVL